MTSATYAEFNDWETSRKAATDFRRGQASPGGAIRQVESVLREIDEYEQMLKLD